MWVLSAFSSRPPQILASSRVFGGFFVPGFLRMFRHGKLGVVTLLFYQELSGEHELLLHLPQVVVLLWDGLLQKCVIMGFVVTACGCWRSLWASSGKAGAALPCVGHNTGGKRFLRLGKTTGESGTGALRCLFDMAYLEVWMNKCKDWSKQWAAGVDTSANTGEKNQFFTNERGEKKKSIGKGLLFSV